MFISFTLIFLKFVLFTECRKVTIIGDSIIKHISGLQGVTIQSFPGDTIAKIANRLQYREAVLRDFDFVILHVGTNDIDRRASFNDIISDFGNLIGICKKLKPSIHVIISSILPRPKDHSVSDSMIRAVNKHLNKVMSKSMKFKFVCSYKPFMYAGSVRRELFAKRDLGLHLNSEGTNALTRFFLRVIATM